MLQGVAQQHLCHRAVVFLGDLLHMDIFKWLEHMRIPDETALARPAGPSPEPSRPNSVRRMEGGRAMRSVLLFHDFHFDLLVLLGSS